MRLAHGSTRIVVLVGPLAIKFPRLRMKWLVIRLFNLLRGRTCQTDREKAKDILKFRNFFSGILANRTEARCWSQTRAETLTPTLFTFFYFMNVQKRGQVLSRREFEQLDKKSLVPPSAIADWSKACNWCLLRGQIRLLDYGNENSRPK